MLLLESDDAIGIFTLFPFIKLDDRKQTDDKYFLRLRVSPGCCLGFPACPG